MTKDLKEHFEEFCNKHYPNKKRKSNRFNNKNWFYVQVGRFFLIIYIVNIIITILNCILNLIEKKKIINLLNY